MSHRLLTHPLRHTRSVAELEVVRHHSRIVEPDAEQYKFMETLALLLIVAAALGAFAIADLCPLSLRWLLVITGLISAVGAYSLFLMPPDFLVRFPLAATVLHPWLVALYGGAAFVLFSGIALGLFGRCVYNHFYARHHKSK